MDNSILKTRAGRFFWRMTARPRTILVITFLIITVAGGFIPLLTKDTSSESFLPPDHPSVLYRNKVKEIFGLADPVVIAVINKGPSGIFNPQTLNLVDWLTERIMEVPGIDPQRVTSLSTENNIVGTEGGIRVEPFFREPPLTQSDAERIRQSVMDFPLYLGSLVARDGQATLIVAELLDPDQGGKIYADLLELADKAPRQTEEIYVAGEGAVKEHLGSYIDSDALRMNPIAALIISLILFVAYRTLHGVLLPNLVVLGAVVIALGSMSAAGVPFYVITNAIPVILIAIGVADGIHIMGQYYLEMARRPDSPQREQVVHAMVQIWRPVTLTSITDIVGFMAISLASSPPPLKALGLFTSVGIAAALAFSLFAIPALLVVLKPGPSRAFSTAKGSKPEGRVDRFGSVVATMGLGLGRRPKWVIATTVIVVLGGTAGAMQLQVNEARIENFKKSEPVYQADLAINQALDGTNYLDIVIEADEPEGLLQPANLKRIEALQDYLETLPHVNGTTSIVDYLKQINRATNEGRREAYRLPQDPDLVAQYFLLYSVSGDPTDFEDKIDYDYRLANVRAAMDSGRYIDDKVVVEAAQRYIDEQFNAPGITAHLSGRVNVDYHWIRELARSHFMSLALSLFMVWLTAAIVFRSRLAGLLAVIPICLSVLVIYAVMGFGGIWLGVGSSIFAAIAIGLGVDFSVHTLDRLIGLVRDERRSLDEALWILFTSTGRALFFNFSAVFLGFGVLATSQVPPLILLGSIVALAVLVSFLGAATVLPAFIRVFKPAFMGFEKKSTIRSGIEASTLTPIGGRSDSPLNNSVQGRPQS